VKPLSQAVAVALLHVLIISSLGGKLLYDRHTRPRAWFKTARYDPNLPIRGRYLGLQVELNDPRTPEEIERKFGKQPQYAWAGYGQECGSIVLRDSTPVPSLDETQTWNCDNLTFIRWHNAIGDSHLRLSEPLLFFIPDTAKDPSNLPRGDELWVLATIPRKGPPRPIALGVKKAGTGEIQQLTLD
jgi:hypothetical protein